VVLVVLVLVLVLVLLVLLLLVVVVVEELVLKLGRVAVRPLQPPSPRRPTLVVFRLMNTWWEHCTECV